MIVIYFPCVFFCYENDIIESAASYHPFFLTLLEFETENNGWEMFTIKEEYKKIINGSVEWRISAVNQDYKVHFLVFYL